jgi:hypothetical protein
LLTKIWIFSQQKSVNLEIKARNMRKSLFKLAKNKQFNYTPRHYEGKSVDNPFDFDSAIRRDRETVNYNDFRAHWKEARDESRTRKNRSFNTKVIIIALILVLIFFFIIDFDFSIFKRK